MSLFDQVLAARGLNSDAAARFLSPDYNLKHDPFLLPDMDEAVDRLVIAREKQEHVTIYGDYDIDGLTATTVLVDAFHSFGFEHVETFIPNRFVEGYGLTVAAVEQIIAGGAQLIVTVDCGSLSHKEIVRAAELGVDVIVTDHHNVAPEQPPAVAVINPKRLLADYPESYERYVLKDNPLPLSAAASGSDKSSTSLDSSAGAAPTDATKTKNTKSGSPNSNRQIPVANLYPFLDLAGVGVAFKLVQALQTRLEGLPIGQEKWLLDLVALGTVCDVVTLLDENRTNVYWGLKVLAQTRRPGLKALMAVARVEPDKLNSRSLGFGLGPRMNAAGRLETAQYSLDMLLARDSTLAYEKAEQLDTLNTARRADQDKIFKEAIIQVEKYEGDPVLVVSGPDWNHGIVGIVAAKLLEKYKKPAYVLQEMGEHTKGSARSYGDFSAADAIRAADDIVTKGGGHKLAAGVTMPTVNIGAFRRRVNEFYNSLKLHNQAQLLVPKADVVIHDFSEVTEELINQLAQLEPFGSGNPEPIFKIENVLVTNQRQMGTESQHVKLELKDSRGAVIQMIAFGAPEHFFVEPGEYVTVLFQPTLNEWQGRRTVEGRILHLETQ